MSAIILKFKVSEKKCWLQSLLIKARCTDVLNNSIIYKKLGTLLFGQTFVIFMR